MDVAAVLEGLMASANLFCRSNMASANFFCRSATLDHLPTDSTAPAGVFLSSVFGVAGNEAGLKLHACSAQES